VCCFVSKVIRIDDKAVTNDYSISRIALLTKVPKAIMQKLVHNAWPMWLA